MKKNLLLLCVLILSLLAVGCGEAKTEASEPADELTSAEAQSAPAASGETAAPAGQTAPADGPAAGGQTAPTDLTAPVLEWWELYNPSGFDSVSALISNPNAAAIDVGYDLVFYKGGSEVARIENCLNESILPGHEDIIWMNDGVPAAGEADDVRMENVSVTETLYPPVDGSYAYKGIVDGEADYEFTFDKPISYATIWFVQYNDRNSNGKHDQGEIVAVCNATLMEQQGIAGYDPGVFISDSCDVFFKAF